MDELFRGDHRLDIAYSPQRKYWQGTESVEFLLRDFRPASRQARGDKC